ncbi:MAG TPA: HD domain-containing protein [Verrucomicrobiae bacterium]|nr:HD domain-containing protein [Verrucomicrobiae bacterium]
MQGEAQSVYLTMFPGGDPLFVPKAFGWAIDCFSGNYRDYQPIDARYHDFEHTLQGTLCLVRIVRGRFLAGAQPVVTRKMFELTLLAILLHDTGYLKHKSDKKGTGAKYTLVHVNRSAEFAATLLAEKGYPETDIAAVQNMIRCTGVNVNLAAIPFRNQLERILGFVLGTADLMGQMAAEDYIDKLPILYSEFAESAQHNSGKMTSGGTFASVEDLLQRTPLFWEKYVKPKIENDFLGVYRFLSVPYPDGPNYYVQRIEANIERLRGRLATAKAA